VCDLVYKVLTKSGIVIHTSAVEPLTPQEREMDSYKKLIKDFDTAVNEQLGLKLAEDDIQEMFDLEGETFPEVTVDQAQLSTLRVHGSVGQKTKDTDNVSSDVSSNDTDPGWETARVNVPRGNGFRRGFVKRKKRDYEGNLIGTPNSNPILDTTVYEVEFDDGMLEDVSVNVIAEALYENADENGFTEGLVLDHFVSRKLTKFKSTKGWFLLVRWKDSSESVVRLSDLK